MGVCGERGTGAATTKISFGSYSASDFTSIQPIDSDYLTCLALLVLYISWSDTRGPPSLLRPASLRAQLVARRHTTWFTALRLSKFDGPSDTTTRLVWHLLCFTTSTVVIKTQTFTNSTFHSQAGLPPRPSDVKPSMLDHDH